MDICNICGTLLHDNNWQSSFKIKNFKRCKQCNNNKIKKNKNINYLKYKEIIFTRLGNVCSCCGIFDKNLLSIDHINGGGLEEKKIRRGYRYLKYLKNLPIEDLKSKYQLLCYNCNYCKGFFSKCAHNASTANLGLISKENFKKRLGRLKLKIETLTAYGGKCLQCEESHPWFLTLDHINNNGYFEKNKKGVEFYRLLKSLGFPKGELQILCHNCNAYKEYQLLRKEKLIIRNLEANNYLKENYSLTKEEDKRLMLLATELFDKNYTYNIKS